MYLEMQITCCFMEIKKNEMFAFIFPPSLFCCNSQSICSLGSQTASKTAKFPIYLEKPVRCLINLPFRISPVFHVKQCFGLLILPLFFLPVDKFSASPFV